MFISLIKKIARRILKGRKIQVTEKFVTFTFFLILASIIWYLNKLGGEYVMDLKLPLRIVYSETDKILVDRGMYTLKIQSKAKGYAILRFKVLSAIRPLTIDISSYRLQHSPTANDLYFILSNTLKANLSSQLPSSIKIENITPDTLFLNFSKSFTKRVAVKAKTSLSFEKQYMQLGHISIIPDSITISGPESIITRKKEIYTKTIYGNKLKEPVSGNITLEIEPNITISTKEVKYGINVAKYTEGKFRLPIHINNKDSGQFFLIPTTAEVSYRVALKDYLKVQPSLFYLVAQDSIQRNSNLSRIKVVKKPSFVTTLRTDPEFVEIYNRK